MKRAVWLLSIPVVSVMILGCSERSQRVEVAGGDARSREIARHLVDMQADDPQVRADSARQLGNMRADSSSAIAGLANGLTDNNQTVRQASAQALANIGTYDALTELRDASRKGWGEARNVYNNVTQDLRQQSQSGDMGARNLLERLGEQDIQ